MSNEEQQEASYDGFDWFTVADNSFPEFSRDEVEVFIQTFKEFDKDGSRSIDSEELATILKAMGQGASPEELKTFMDIVDEDKSGEIEWPEFLRLMRLFYPEKRASYNRTFLDPARKFPEFTKDDIVAFIRVFRSFDEDGSGSINLYELRKMFKAMGQGATDEELQEIISFADQDGSGEIEFEEFLRIMRMFYPEKRRAFEREFYLPAVDFPEFIRDEIDVFIQAFREFDADASGAIDAKELETAFKAMGQATDPREIQKIFDLVDEDQSGEIEWPEFLTIMRFLYPEKRAKFIKEFYLPANDFPEFTKPEIDVFVQAFRKFDLDGSGSIDARELHIALLAMGVGSTPEAAQKILKSVDANNSGVIEWPEFLQIMRILYPDRLKEFQAEYYTPAKNFPQFSNDDIAVFIQAFRTFDLDGSKSINAKELGLVFKTMGQGMTEGQIKQVIQKFDTDGSGEIEWAEFLSIMAALYGDAPAPQKKAAPQQQEVAQKVEAPKEAPKEVPKVEAPKAEAPKAEPPKANPTPAPVQSFQKAPVQAKEPPKVQVGAQRGNQCTVCSKTVYPLEALSAGDKIFHKGCFRCQAEGCGLTLTLKNYVVSGGLVFCQKHTPKDKPTSVGVEGNITMKSAVSAPKLNKQTGIQKNVRTTFGPGELNVEKK